jgi:ankyrin repeat protein
VASFDGHAKIARDLIDHGADTMAQDKYGWTAMDLASRWDHAEIARLLFEHGATAQNDDEQTPLEMRT